MCLVFQNSPIISSAAQSSFLLFSSEFTYVLYLVIVNLNSTITFKFNPITKEMYISIDRFWKCLMSSHILNSTRVNLKRAADLKSSNEERISRQSPTNEKKPADDNKKVM